MYICFGYGYGAGVRGGVLYTSKSLSPAVLRQISGGVLWLTRLAGRGRLVGLDGWLAGPRAV